MKNYHLIKPADTTDEIRVVNDDENPVIEYISFSIAFMSYAGRYVYNLEIQFKRNAETQEMRQQFLNISNREFINDFECVMHRSKLNTIFKYLELVNTIDPIPLQAYADVMEALPPFDFSSFLNRGEVEQLVAQGEHNDALKLALEADSKGDQEILVTLSNMYNELGDFDNYRNVLSHIPTTNPFFVEANQQLHDVNQSISLETIETPQDPIDQLEKKFRNAFHAGLSKEASCYFDELCGNAGVNPEIDNIKGDVDTLIQIASRERRMKAEIEYLRAMLAEKTDQKPAPNRMRMFS